MNVGVADVGTILGFELVGEMKVFKQTPRTSQSTYRDRVLLWSQSIYIGRYLTNLTYFIKYCIILTT